VGNVLFVAKTVNLQMTFGHFQGGQLGVREKYISLDFNEDTYSNLFCMTDVSPSSAQTSL
jgi:hypothetical protein